MFIVISGCSHQVGFASSKPGTLHDVGKTQIRNVFVNGAVNRIDKSGKVISIDSQENWNEIKVENSTEIIGYKCQPNFDSITLGALVSVAGYLYNSHTLVARWIEINQYVGWARVTTIGYRHQFLDAELTNANGSVNSGRAVLFTLSCRREAKDVTGETFSTISVGDQIQLSGNILRTKSSGTRIAVVKIYSITK